MCLEKGEQITMVLNKQSQFESQAYVIQTPEGPDIEFTGVAILDRMTATGGHIKIFGTDSGRYVVEQARSALRGRPALRRVAVVDHLDEMAEIIGDTSGGKQVMEELGIRCRVSV